MMNPHYSMIIWSNKEERPDRMEQERTFARSRGAIYRKRGDQEEGPLLLRTGPKSEVLRDR